MGREIRYIFNVSKPIYVTSYVTVKSWWHIPTWLYWKYGSGWHTFAMGRGSFVIDQTQKVQIPGM